MAAFIYMLMNSLIVATALTIAARIIVAILKRTNIGPLPPGPKGLPFVGNVTDLPLSGVREYEHWLKHKDFYGLFYLFGLVQSRIN
jgi:hypothetical protein